MENALIAELQQEKARSKWLEEEVGRLRELLGMEPLEEEEIEYEM